MTDNNEQQIEEDNKPKSFFDKLALNMLNIKDEESLLSILDKAVKSKAIDVESQDMISGVLKIASLDVKDVMLSRTKMVAVNLGMTVVEIFKKVISSSHTRIPVFCENKEEILGILHTKDLLKLIFDIEIEDKTSKELEIQDVKDILRPTMFVHETKKLNSLLRDFKNSQNHIALIVDEYGAISGLVTIEDILEEIVGDIDDEFDISSDFIKKISENKFLVDATIYIEDFNEYFKTELDDGDEFDTIAGMIIQHLEHLPIKGESITLNNYKFTINEATTRKITNIIVEKQKS